MTKSQPSAPPITPGERKGAIRYLRSAFRRAGFLSWLSANTLRQDPLNRYLEDHMTANRPPSTGVPTSDEET